MTWQSVGTHTFVPTDKAVQVGSFDLAAGQDTIWVRITQLNSVDDWPWSYGILSWRNANGTPLGSIKAYSNRLGEVFRLGNGLPPSDGTGSIWFEPRGFNLGWLKAGFPWELQFEAQAGSTDVSTSYWNRDPVNGVLSPVTAGDDVDIGTGFFTAGAANFLDGMALLRNFGSSGSPNLDFALDDGLGTGARADLGLASARAYLLLARSDSAPTNEFAIAVGTKSVPDQAFKVTYAGVASFAGRAHFDDGLESTDVLLQSSDPAFRTADGYIGPELSLVEEIVRLEALVQHLYETFRLAPPSGWDVWDGNNDLAKSRGKKKGHI